MGSYGCHRPKGLTTAQFMAQELGCEILVSNIANSVFYAAARNPGTPEEVFALVMPFKRYSGYENFVYKDQDETMGPCDIEASRKVLEALTPTEDDYAREWRAACWARLGGRPAELVSR